MSTTITAEAARHTLKSYIIGFVLALASTVLAFILVEQHPFTKWVTASAIVLLALAQFVVQILLFLHIAEGAGRRWRILIFAFMTLVVAILVGGSIWIMYNLDEHMSSYPTTDEVNSYMQNQSGGL